MCRKTLMLFTQGTTLCILMLRFRVSGSPLLATHICCKFFPTVLWIYLLWSMVCTLLSSTANLTVHNIRFFCFTHWFCWASEQPGFIYECGNIHLANEANFKTALMCHVQYVQKLSEMINQPNEDPQCNSPQVTLSEQKKHVCIFLAYIDPVLPQWTSSEHRSPSKAQICTVYWWECY